MITQIGQNVKKKSKKNMALIFYGSIDKPGKKTAIS